MVEKTFFHLLQLCLINAQKLYNMHRINQNLKPLSLLSYTIQVSESLTGVDKSTDISTTITSRLPFTLENFHRCKKINPTKPKFQRTYVVCKYKLRYSLEPSKKRAKKTFMNALFVKFLYVLVTVLLNIIHKKNIDNKLSIFFCV